jgi:hypothetical protein
VAKAWASSSVGRETGWQRATVAYSVADSKDDRTGWLARVPTWRQGPAGRGSRAARDVRHRVRDLSQAWQASGTGLSLRDLGFVMLGNPNMDHFRVKYSSDINITTNSHSLPAIKATVEIVLL